MGVSLAVVSLVLAWALSVPAGLFPGSWLEFAERCLICLAVCILLSFVWAFLLLGGIDRGWAHFKRSAPLVLSLRRALLDAGYSVTRCWLLGEYEELPRMDFRLVGDGGSALLRVENSIRFDKKLDGVDVSSALRGYVLERSYQSDDRDWYIYELIDAVSDFGLGFETLEEFSLYAGERCDRWHLFLDGRTTVPLSSALLVGQTGSGKTYALASLILQMWEKGAEVSLCDPKRADVNALSVSLGLGDAAVSPDEIAASLDLFVSQMAVRKEEMALRLATRMVSTYEDFGLEPHVLVIDEYAALSYAMRSRDKKFRDAVAGRIAEVVLQGRQLGFFIMIAMQKSDASLIDTAMRENLPLVVVLGNAQPQTVVTAFGSGVDLPARSNGPGEGWFTCPQIAPTPKLVQFPDLRFLASGDFGRGGGSCNDPRPHSDEVTPR